jgi:hypothetical protein
MTIEADYLGVMPSTVTVYPVASTDAYGKLTFGATGVSTRCRVQETGKVVKNADSNDVYEVGTIIFYGNPSITTESKIVLPDGTSPLILSVRVYNDEFGAHHTTVSFGN